jgi:hypothetical protein
MATHKAPGKPEKHQGEYGIPQTEMPNHGVATHIAGDDQTYHACGQSPMEQTGGQIPNANCEHGYFHGCGKEKIMRN